MQKWFGWFAIPTAVSCLLVAPSWAASFQMQGQETQYQGRLLFVQEAGSFEEWFDRCQQLRGQEAVDACDRAIELNPNDAVVWLNRGVRLGKDLGRTQDSLAAFDRAIELDPSYSLAYYNRCNAQIRLEQYEVAVVSCQQAIDKDGRWGDAKLAYAWDMKGLALAKLGRHEESLAAHDRAVELDPTDPISWYNRGVALSDLQRYEEAIASYDKVLELNPNDESARNNREILRRRLGQ